jgi:hypothetical protein
MDSIQPSQTKAIALETALTMTAAIRAPKCDVVVRHDERVRARNQVQPRCTARTPRNPSAGRGGAEIVLSRLNQWPQDPVRLRR